MRTGRRARRRTRPIASKGAARGSRDLVASDSVPMHDGRPSSRLPFATLQPKRRGVPQQLCCAVLTMTHRRAPPAGNGGGGYGSAASWAIPKQIIGIGRNPGASTSNTERALVAPARLTREVVGTAAEIVITGTDRLKPGPKPGSKHRAPGGAPQLQPELRYEQRTDPGSSLRLKALTGAPAPVIVRLPSV